MKDFRAVRVSGCARLVRGDAIVDVLRQAPSPLSRELEELHEALATARPPFVT